MKKFFAGLIIGAGLMFSLSASADSLSKVGKVVQGEMEVRVNGQTLDTAAIVVDGSSFLPVRAMAGAIGGSVNFDGKSVDVVMVEPKEEKVVAEEEIVEETNERNYNRVYREWRHYFLKRQVAEFNLQIAKTDEARAQFQAEIEELDKIIAELEAEKSELEAQLAETP